MIEEKDCRTVVGDWRFDNLCESHLQSQSAQVVETSVADNSPSQDSNHPDDHFESITVANDHRLATEKKIHS